MICVLKTDGAYKRRPYSEELRVLDKEEGTTTNVCICIEASAGVRHETTRLLFQETCGDFGDSFHCLFCVKCQMMLKASCEGGGSKLQLL